MSKTLNVFFFFFVSSNRFSYEMTHVNCGIFSKVEKKCIEEFRSLM